MDLLHTYAHIQIITDPKERQITFVNPLLIGTKSMQNTSAYEEPRSSGKRLHEYSFDHRSIQNNLCFLLTFINILKYFTVTRLPLLTPISLTNTIFHEIKVQWGSEYQTF